LRKSETFIGGFFIAAFIFTISLFFVYSYWKGTTVSTEVDSETINGILTVSGIIFGFQFAFFKTPKEKGRIIWIILFLCEVVFLAIAATVYVHATIYGIITTDTLLFVFLSFLFILASTVFIAMIDWMWPMVMEDAVCPVCGYEFEQ
jgi:hypothetical protein